MDSISRVHRTAQFLYLGATLVFGVGLMAACGSSGSVERSQTDTDTLETSQQADDGPSLREKRKQYSTYYEQYKGEDFTGARPSLLWILERAPKFPDGDDRNYRRAVKLYEGLAAQSSEKPLKSAFLDTAATYLSTAPEEMERLEIPFELYKWEVRKGRFMEHHRDALSTSTLLESPSSHYKKAFYLAPKEIDSYYIRQILISYLEADTLDGALDFAETAKAKRGNDQKVVSLAELVRERVFAKDPQAKLSYLKTEIDQHPDSTQLLAALFTTYIENDNPSEASVLADLLMKQNPSAETIREIAEMRLKKGDHGAAVSAYDRAVQEGARLEYQDYFNRGTAYERIGQPAKARREYRNAINMNESFGQAYIGIGDLYARAVNQCSGKAMERRDRAVYWAAVDKYQLAKNVDPSVVGVATRRIDTYAEVFPTQEDIFYQTSWDSGASFPIDYGCYSWINETTTVRAAPSSD